MPEITLYNMDGKDLGSLSLPESVFGLEPNIPLIHQAVLAEEANARQGTADTKTRSEVRGGGKKPWKQKGTGRARQGSTRAPHWRHGGVVFGPHPRSYNQSFPKKMRHGALRGALSAKVLDGEVIGIDQLVLPAVKTGQVASILGKLPLTREVNVKHYNADQQIRATKQKQYKVLLIVPEHDETLLLSVRNLQDVTIRTAPNFSVRDVVAAGRIVLAAGAVEKIESVLGRESVALTPEEASV